VALPTVLLGAGWFYASLREQAALRRERERVLTRTADAVRGAVDESLEELRRREDQRPFYLYNPVYSPPDVVSVVDPVAPSPLAHDPDDPRIVGYFQVEPGGAVLTPYAAGAPDPRTSPRGARVVALVASAPFEPVRALSRGSGAAPTPVERDEPVEPPSQAPLTTNLNPWSQNVLNDIQQAQAGDVEANRRIQERGRTAPITVRNFVSWEQVGQQRPQEVRVEPQAAHATPDAGRPEGGRRRERPRAGRRPVADRPDSEAQPSPPPVRQTEAQVDYTPMAWRALGSELVLHRVVSHEGTAVVQGVVLDREYLVRRWIPALVRRHAVSGIEPSVVEGDDTAECAILRPVSEVLDGVGLCYADGALARVPGDSPGAVRGVMVPLELASLAGLVLVVTLAGFAMYRATRRADELSRQKSAFVSAVSHELRTPLTTIRMHAEMLRDGLVTEARRPRFHDQLVQESVRLSHLVDNVLELSRIEEGRRVLDAREGDLRAAVAKVIDEQRNLLAQRGFEVRGPEGGGEPVIVSFDAQAVSQIVVNLLDNAAKYGRGNENVIEVGVMRDGGGVLLSVRDRGPGIPAREREKVFERFHRVEVEGQAHMPGTGIGLSLVRELARAHGGDAEVHAAPDGGCEVRVTLP
jgi:signal transduction histidine kinase